MVLSMCRLCKGQRADFKATRRLRQERVLTWRRQLLCNRLASQKKKKRVLETRTVQAAQRANIKCAPITSWPHTRLASYAVTNSIYPLLGKSWFHSTGSRIPAPRLFGVYVRSLALKFNAVATKLCDFLPLSATAQSIHTASSQSSPAPVAHTDLPTNE